MHDFDTLKTVGFTFLDELRDFDFARVPWGNAHADNATCNTLLDSVIHHERLAVTETAYFDNLFDLTLRQTVKQDVVPDYARNHQDLFFKTMYGHIAIASSLNCLQTYADILDDTYFAKTKQGFGALERTPESPALVDQFLTALGDHVAALPDPAVPTGTVIADQADTKDHIRRNAQWLLAANLM